MFWAAALLAVQDQTTADAVLGRLSQERASFNDLVVDDEAYFLVETIYTMPLDQHLIGYYPEGVGTRRYLVNWNGDPHTLVYQRVDADGKARSQWRLELIDSKKPPRFHGTLARLLHSQGKDVEGRVTAAQRVALNTEKAFAVYGLDGEAGNEMGVSLLNPDGSETKTRHFGETRIYPIIDAEAERLGFGKVYWPKDLPFQLRDY